MYVTRMITCIESFFKILNQQKVSENNIKFYFFVNHAINVIAHNFLVTAILTFLLLQK